MNKHLAQQWKFISVLMKNKSTTQNGVEDEGPCEAEDRGLTHREQGELITSLLWVCAPLQGQNWPQGPGEPGSSRYWPCVFPSLSKKETVTAHAWGTDEGLRRGCVGMAQGAAGIGSFPHKRGHCKGWGDAGHPSPKHTPSLLHLHLLTSHAPARGIQLWPQDRGWLFNSQ